MNYLQIWNDNNIKGYEKLVLIYLIDNYSEIDGYSSPIRTQIQKETGITKNTLSKVLGNLISKGYITRVTNPHKSGKNNIYFINKYMPEAPGDAKTTCVNNAKIENPCEKDAKTDAKEIEASTNELLVNQNCNLTTELTDDDIVEVNKMDTDRLLKAINQANKTKGNIPYHINYIKKTYRNIQNNPSEPQREVSNDNSINNSNNRKKDNRKQNNSYVNKNYPVKTKYHDTFNEHFRKYTEEELELQLLKIQNSRKN